MLVVAGVIVGLMCWILIFRHWQRGIVMLLSYLPFAGAVTLLLYPSLLPTVFKDFLFVIPAYLAFLPSKERGASKGHVPISIILAMLILAILVFVQMFNPDVANWLVAAIGAKVWLFYLPLLFLAFAMINTRQDLIGLLRLMVTIAWIPCGVGIMEWIGSMIFGYEGTMEAIYGAAAAGATQDFSSFDIGGEFFRIPSTFSFVAQYFGYTLAMIVPAYALMKMEPSGKLRGFATVTFLLVILASLLSGARGAYLFVPILLALIYLLEGKGIEVARFAIVSPLFLLMALYIAGINPSLMFDLMRELVSDYYYANVQRGLLDAIANVPWGLGTGMNTGPARYAFDDPESFFAFENYYAKAVYELGIGGLVIVVALFLVLLVHGYRNHHRIQDVGFRSCSGAILAFIVTMVLNSFKGWQIDLDPINVYFWIFAGILLKLKYLNSHLLNNRTALRGSHYNQYTSVKG